MTIEPLYLLVFPIQLLFGYRIIRIMTTLIFGVGVGLFLILSLWLLAGVLFLISLRVEKKFGTFVILIVGIFTVVLVSIPRGSNKSNVSENKV